MFFTASTYVSILKTTTFSQYCGRWVGYLQIKKDKKMFTSSVMADWIRIRNDTYLQDPDQYQCGSKMMHRFKIKQNQITGISMLPAWKRNIRSN
jgi:hypothetical protein